ncbi:MAG: aspartate ammonia-lyase, partial [Solirubrobacterales bacterium]|nr:aspartate ammonia-lyase [Solirubrobacterales bacterium]
LRTVAVSLYKCATDLRWMGSGPRTGLAEIRIPDLQPGSSIMPGKVNPVLPEAVCQVVSQVVGNDAAVAFGGAAGNFELNVMLPVIARNLLESIRLLSSTARAFAEKCVEGIEANEEGCHQSAESTLAAATALNPYVGYDKATEIVKEAASSGRLLREVAAEMGVDEETYNKAMDLREMARGNT